MLSSSDWDTTTTSSIVLTRRQGTAAVRDAMDRLLRALEHADLDFRQISKLNGGDEAEMLIAERIPLQAWNKFAQLEVLPRSLRLRQLVWDDDKVRVVEYPLSLLTKVPSCILASAFLERSLARDQKTLLDLAPMVNP